MCNTSAVPVSLERVRVLLISAVPEDHVALQHIFDRSAWLLRRVTTCRDALADICEHGTPIVICERELPDGDWRLVLSELESLPLRPNVIVTSRLADDSLWAEVLNVGAYDLLVQPFDADEVFRVYSWHGMSRTGALTPVYGAEQRLRGVWLPPDDILEPSPWIRLVAYALP